MTQKLTLDPEGLSAALSPTSNLALSALFSSSPVVHGFGHNWESKRDDIFTAFIIPLQNQ
ncbi:hypothetical protein NC652_041501 [Populus alba x Populus x berolinensis]|nr:hypothetical protein NC652_041501 [Populus alba x Populus x berolinensis]